MFWTHIVSSAVSGFLASLVEFVEALTVILAIGAVRGWRWALAGAGAGLAVLAVATALLGPALGRLPVADLQLGIGVLLVLFGLRWLRKAVLRAAGVLRLHDEMAEYAQAKARFGRGGRFSGWDFAAFGGAMQIVLLEGVEVVFIVLAVGAGSGGFLAAGTGAAAALLAVIVLGVALHRPVAAIPENTLKFVVGVLLCAFGTFWTGEGLGGVWPGADFSLPALVAIWGLLATGGVALARPGATAGMTRKNWLLRLFVDDFGLAAGSLGCIAAIRVALLLGLPPVWAACLLTAGLGAVLLWSVSRAAR